MTEEMHPLTDAVVRGKRADVERLVNEALEAGEQPVDIVEQKLVPGMGIVGDRFKRNEIFVPEMLIAARAMKTAMELLEPELVKAGLQPEFKVVIGTVKGDLHDIGKNLVAMMLKGANFAVVDLGTNVTAEAFVAAAKEHSAQIVGLSALLTTTMPAMEATVKAIREAGIDARVMVGGAPVTKDFAERIGADGYAADAASAVDEARRLVAA